MTRIEWNLRQWRLRVANRRLRFARLIRGCIYIPGTAEVCGSPYFRPCAAIWPGEAPEK